MAERSPEYIAIYDALPLPERRRADRAVPPVLHRHDHERLYPTTGWIGEYLLYCQEMEAPLGWHFWAAVSLLGLVARRNFYIDRGVYFLYLNHYVLILGPSGLTKSTTIGRLQGIFKYLAAKVGGQYGLEHIWVSPDRITQQKLTSDLTKWTKDHEDRKDTILFMVNDELATLAGKNVKGADVLIDFLTACYAKDSYKDSTIVGGNRELINAAITCLFGTTPSSMKRNITEGLFTEGFMGRTITVPRDYVDRRGVYARPPPVDPVTSRLLANQLEPWLLIDREVEVQPTPEADEWMDSWYEAHIAAVPDEEKLVAFWRRKQDHAYKLAGVLALSAAVAKGPAGMERLVVDLPTLQLALHLLEDEERRLPDAFAMIGAREEAQDIYRLQAYIEKKYAETGEPVPHSAIFQNCRHFIKDARHLREMEDTLMESGVIEMLGGVGRRFKPKGK